ncbi:hypothetical protein [Curtobacterium flaccumfaciens]|uniref:hypothetical protein n=1 Tax=Curtobacterium flaccumfaciens TaxID=2035 RepID=UPI00387A5D1D
MNTSAPTLFNNNSASNAEDKPQSSPKVESDSQSAPKAQEKPQEAPKAQEKPQSAPKAQEKPQEAPKAQENATLTLAEAARELGWVAVRLTQPKIKAVLEERGAMFGKGRGGSLIPRAALEGLAEQFPVRPRAKNGTHTASTTTGDSEVAVLAAQVERLQSRVDEARQIVRDESAVLNSKKRELAQLVKKRRKTAEVAFERARAELNLITELDA